MLPLVRHSVFSICSVRRQNPSLPSHKTSQFRAGQFLTRQPQAQLKSHRKKKKKAVLPFLVQHQHLSVTVTAAEEEGCEHRTKQSVAPQQAKLKQSPGRAALGHVAEEPRTCPASLLPLSAPPRAADSQPDTASVARALS